VWLFMAVREEINEMHTETDPVDYLVHLMRTL